MFVPAAKLVVVSSATPSVSVTPPIAPFWSLKVTVPPFGVAPPVDRSLTVATNVTDWPRAAEAVEETSAVTVGRALNRARCSRRPTWGRNCEGDRSLCGRRSRRKRVCPGTNSPAPCAGTAIGASRQRAPNRSTTGKLGSNRWSVARSRSGIVMADALPRRYYDLRHRPVPDRSKKIMTVVLHDSSSRLSFNIHVQHQTDSTVSCE